MSGVVDNSVAQLREPVVDGRAWTRGSLSEGRWRLKVPRDCLGEINQVVAELSRHPVPRWLLDPADFALLRCADLMHQVKRSLDEGPGMALLDRLPIEQWTPEIAGDVFWLLGVLVSRPVVQTIDGQIMVEVTDTGVKKTIGVRGFRTNVGQHPHVDNSFNETPPDYVSLLSIRTAVEGGMSQLISFFSVHNRMLEAYPDLLARLYEPFYQDRQGDFWPGELQTIFAPVFALGPDGESDLRCRYTNFTIPAGYKTAGVEFDGLSRRAFEAMTEVIEDPALYCEFTMNPGELQFVNNRYCGHGRTAYRDDPQAKRLALRLWHRSSGKRSYGG